MTDVNENNQHDMPINDSTSYGNQSSTMITQAQYQQLISLLNQHQIDPQASFDSGKQASSSSAFMAGPITKAASGPW